MDKKVIERFEELLRVGEQLMRSIPKAVYPTDVYGNVEVVQEELKCRVDGVQIPKYQQWLNSVVNLINYTVPNVSHFAKECSQLMADEELKMGIPSRIIQKMYGLLAAVKEELDHGILGQIEFSIVGGTFDDFLDHAETYHKSNKKLESAVLSSAVLEDTVKKICKKNGIEASGKKLDGLISELVHIGVLTQVKAKRVRSFAGVRNFALHAEWEKFDISDVGALIKGTRELIEKFL